jgi:hypothetical protein
MHTIQPMTQVRSVLTFASFKQYIVNYASQNQKQAAKLLARGKQKMQFTKDLEFFLEIDLVRFQPSSLSHFPIQCLGSWMMGK